MYYSAIKNLDIANGPGCRVSLFVSGCRNHCPGCFQPETWDFNYGKPFDREAKEKIFELLKNPHIKGLSILGGDPMEPENLFRLTDLCFEFRLLYPNKTIWLWTGYLWKNIKDFEIMNYLDVVVDGPFIESRRNLMLPYCGSGNQRVIDVQKSRLEGAVRLWWDPTKSYEDIMMGKIFDDGSRQSHAL